MHGDGKVSEQKVPLLTGDEAKHIAGCGLGNGSRQALLAIGDGRAVVIPRAELEAKDARIAALLAALKGVIRTSDRMPDGDAYFMAAMRAAREAIAGEIK